MLSRRIRRALGVLLAMLVLLLGGCQPAVSAPAAPFAAAPSATPEEADGAAEPAAVEVAAQNPPSSPTPLPTSTAVPTATPTATPAATATATIAPTATPTGPCAARMPGDDLLTVVTQTYGLSKEYEPQDLVALIDYLPFEVTLGYPTELREVAVEPLVEMITAMQAEGLRPQVISGYRSYVAQVIARNKWEEQYPGHVGIISALPGHSEHQLGTAVDFGSPELPEIVGEEDIEFHTYFYQTSEGKWLAEHAHRYGFTLSYTREAFETTGFFYEPWHYRYVGVETATMLRDQGLTLTEYQLRDGEPPCTE